MYQRKTQAKTINITRHVLHFQSTYGKRKRRAYLEAESAEGGEEANYLFLNVWEHDERAGNPRCF
jgi:hypothetical protein